jgi:hypothetical protein
MMRSLIGGAALCIGAVTAVDAQMWRVLDASGGRRDSSEVSVRIDYSRGQLRTRPAELGNQLYDLHLRYDATRAHPLLTYDSATRALTIGTEVRQDTRTSGEGRSTGEAVVQLGRVNPLDVTVRLDVATATLDFGGIPLRGLSVQSSASEVRVGFDSPNPSPMDALELDVSAATLTASGLGNANATRLRVGARGAGAELHLDGQWTRDLQVDLDVALGSVTVYVPSDVGVELDARRIIAKVDAGGLQKSGDLFVSGNFASAPRKVRIRASATLAKLQLVHGTR